MMLTKQHAAAVLAKHNGDRNEAAFELTAIVAGKSIDELKAQAKREDWAGQLEKHIASKTAAKSPARTSADERTDEMIDAMDFNHPAMKALDSLGRNAGLLALALKYAAVTKVAMTAGRDPYGTPNGSATVTISIDQRKHYQDGDSVEDRTLWAMQNMFATLVGNEFARMSRVASAAALGNKGTVSAADDDHITAATVDAT